MLARAIRAHSKASALLLATALAACSAPSRPVSTSSGTSGSRADAFDEASSRTGAAVPTPARDNGRCLASIAQRRLPGWTERGTIVVELEDGQPRSMEARADDGAVVATKPAPKSKEDARAVMKDLTCRLGGVIATLDGAEPPAARHTTANFVVLAPAVVDEKADLLALCNKPDGGTGADKPRLTFDRLEQQLTSRRWRGWLFDLAEEHEHTSGSERMMLHWRKADELAEAARRAGIRGSCWFESQLRSPDG